MTTMLIPLTAPLSVAGLMEEYDAQFYQYQFRDEPKFDLPIIHETRLVDQQALLHYKNAVQNGMIALGRPGNIPESSIVTPPPPLLETLVWWLNTTIEHGGHGMTANMTPTSTFHDGRRLGISFVRYEWLRIGFTMTRKVIIHPRD